MTEQPVTLADRRAVYALLDRMLDWLPPARLSVRRPDPANSEPGKGSWRRCGRCAGSGRVTGEGAHARPCRQPHVSWPFGHGCRPCANCDFGWVHVHTPKGAPMAGQDPMLSTVRDELATAAHERAERRRWVDAQLVKLQALQLQHAGVEAADDEFTRAHAAKERLYGTGSFRQLDAALELLAVEWPLRHAAVVFFVVEAQLPPNPDTRVRLDETVGWLAARMPREILLPADAKAEVAAWKHTLEHGRSAQHRVLREARNREIRLLVEEHGWSLRKVGRHYDLSHVAVRNILGAALKAIA